MLQITHCTVLYEAKNNLMIELWTTIKRHNHSLAESRLCILYIKKGGAISEQAIAESGAGFSCIFSLALTLHYMTQALNAVSFSHRALAPLTDGQGELVSLVVSFDQNTIAVHSIYTHCHCYRN